MWYSVPVRRLSSADACFLLGQAAPGARCRVRVSSETPAIDGAVTQCRYLAGSAGIYEIHVEFDSPIQLSTLRQVG